MIKRSTIALMAMLMLMSASLFSQTPTTIKANGKYLIGICGDTIVLRGVNYALYNWGWSTTYDKIPQIAQSNANCIRMVWYMDQTPTAYQNLVYLDSAISKCIQNKMIPIVELHDSTCKDNNSIVPLGNWWLGVPVKALINKYKHSIIINIGNEVGKVMWASNPTAAKLAFQNAYNTVVANFRSNGLNIPIMIDAPDCGQNLDDLMSIAVAMQNADPQKNLIFSGHAYWNTYANNDSATMHAKLVSALSKSVPIVLGEIANQQDGSSNCQYNLKYIQLLRSCQMLNVPWIAWSWDNDVCTLRRVASNGNFNSLTAYGQVIVNDSKFGLFTKAKRTTYLLNNKSCPSSTGLNGLLLGNKQELILLNYEGQVPVLYSVSNEALKVDLYEITGKLIQCYEIGAYEKRELRDLPAGLFLANVNGKNVTQALKIIHN